MYKVVFTKQALKDLEKLKEANFQKKSKTKKTGVFDNRCILFICLSYLRGEIFAPRQMLIFILCWLA